MKEIFVEANSLPEAYHKALKELWENGTEVDCPAWKTNCLECGMTLVVNNPLEEPRISKYFPGGPYDLERYRQEMLDGILDFRIGKGWDYTYHNRIVEYSIGSMQKYFYDTGFEPVEIKLNQIEFVIDELRKDQNSRRAVIDVRNNREDAYSEDPACFAAGTKISTPNGEVRIEDIHDGDCVYAYDFEHDKVIRAIVSDKFEKVDEIHRISTDFGSIDVSKDQKIYTDSGWKSAKSIIAGDKIIYYPQPEHEHSFFHLVGCIIGDGWLSTPTVKIDKNGVRRGERKEIGLSVHYKSDDENVLKLLSSFTENKPHLVERTVNSGLVKGDHISKKYDLCDVALYDKLEKYIPAGRKVSGVRMKFVASDLNREEKIDFLTGLFSAEGSVSENCNGRKTIQIGMNWKECMDVVCDMLDGLSVIYHRYYSDKTGVHSVRIDNRDGICSFIDSGIDFRYDTRKQAKYGVLKKQYEIAERFDIRVIPHIGEEYIGNSVMIPVRSVEYVKCDTVYDFTVGHKDHSIIANGIVCHNCLQHIQYFIRNGKLDCMVLFRSNDALEATFMNAFALIELQSRIAKELGAEVGTYTHRANSFHVYEKDCAKLEGVVKNLKPGKYSNAYFYKGDWEEQMAEERPRIAKFVEGLKNG